MIQKKESQKEIEKQEVPGGVSSQAIIDDVRRRVQQLTTDLDKFATTVEVKELQFKNAMNSYRNEGYDAGYNARKARDHDWRANQLPQLLEKAKQEGRDEVLALSRGEGVGEVKPKVMTGYKLLNKWALTNSDKAMLGSLLEGIGAGKEPPSLRDVYCRLVGILGLNCYESKAIMRGNLVVDGISGEGMSQITKVIEALISGQYSLTDEKGFTLRV